jgi:hypothetical protein
MLCITFGGTLVQTNPLVREGAAHQETRKHQTENKNLVMGPTPRQTGRLTVST